MRLSLAVLATVVAVAGSVPAAAARADAADPAVGRLPGSVIRQGGRPGCLTVRGNPGEAVTGVPVGFHRRGFSAMLPLTPNTDGSGPQRRLLGGGGVVGAAAGDLSARRWPRSVLHARPAADRRRTPSGDWLALAAASALFMATSALVRRRLRRLG